MIGGEVPLRLTLGHGGITARCLCGTARPARSQAVLLSMAVHAAACVPGRNRAAATPMLAGELPLRVTLRREGAGLACVCGAEAAAGRRAAVNDSMLGLRGSGRAMTWMHADLSPGGIDRMTAHIVTCPAALAAVPERTTHAS